MSTMRSMCFAYNNRTGSKFPDIDLDSGQQLLIPDRSEVGKSSLLQLMTGLIFQWQYFIKTLSLQENLSLVQYSAGAKANKERIMEVPECLGVAHKSSEKPHYRGQDGQNCKKVANLLIRHAEITAAQLFIIIHDQRLKAQFQNTFTL